MFFVFVEFLKNLMVIENRCVLDFFHKVRLINHDFLTYGLFACFGKLEKYRIENCGRRVQGVFLFED